MKVYAPSMFGHQKKIGMKRNKLVPIAVPAISGQGYVSKIHRKDRYIGEFPDMFNIGMMIAAKTREDSGKGSVVGRFR